MITARGTYFKLKKSLRIFFLDFLTNIEVERIGVLDDKLDGIHVIKGVPRMRSLKLLDLPELGV